MIDTASCLAEAASPGLATRAALYLRVSTGRQAESDLSIPDQRRQAENYAASRGWEVVADYAEPASPPPTTAAPSSSV